MKKKEVKKLSDKKNKNDSPGALFIPAGVLTGIGLGFLFGNLPAGLFIGLGIGFIFFAVIETIISLGNRK